MLNYRAPLNDYSFFLHELLRTSERLSECFDPEVITPDLMNSIIEEAAKLCEANLLPINRDGDEAGCRLIAGAVTTPPGLKEAYHTFMEGGWVGLSSDPSIGGQGLPFLLNVVLHEIMMACNLSFADYIGLPQAAAKTIAVHGSTEQRELYGTRVARGEWCATMCMTEPHCGTDLGLVQTSAKPQDDGSYRINGTKIFISAGDHDLTENIVHLVLARLPDAPAGVKGLSLFLCPKYIASADGTIGGRNPVHAATLEKKMGYRAAATCEMVFDDAAAWMLGEPNRGLPAMFTMVNVARLLVALQGLGTAEAAYQSAAAYARDRRQGRALGGAVEPDAKADLLIVHPDVRRMLLSTRAFTEAGRAIVLWFAIQNDISERHPDEKSRELAADLVGLLTPVIKASFSDLGFNSCNDCMQVFGGHGYIREWGMEQLVRDVRIAQIQEGANGVQALDLIGRKLRMNEGRSWQAFLHMLDSFIAEHSSVEMEEFVRPLSAARDQLAAATDKLLVRIGVDPNEMGAAGVDYQRAFALVLFAWMWAWIASHSLRHENETFHEAKLATARYFFSRELPRLRAHLSVAAAGAESLMALPASHF